MDRNAEPLVVGVDGSAASDAAVRWAVHEVTMRGLLIALITDHWWDARKLLSSPTTSWGASSAGRQLGAQSTICHGWQLTVLNAESSAPI